MENDREEDTEGFEIYSFKVSQDFNFPHYFIHRSTPIRLIWITRNCESFESVAVSESLWSARMGLKQNRSKYPERKLKYLASLILSQKNFSLDLLPIVIQKHLRLLKVGRGWAEWNFYECVLGAWQRGWSGLSYRWRNLAAAANSWFLTAKRVSLSKGKHLKVTWMSKLA